MHHPHPLTALALLALLAKPATPAATVTLTNSPAYASQRPCAKTCFYTGFTVDGGPDELADDIGCGTDPIENECFCRGDLQNEALNLLQSCVSDMCDRKDTDIQAALSIYENYCTSNGYTRDAIPTPTASSGKSTTTSTTALTSSSSSTQSAPTTKATTTAQSSVTEAASTTSSSADTAETESRSDRGGGGGGSGVDGGEIAGIVVGVLSFIATSVGVWYAHKALKSRKSAAAAAAATSTT